MVWSEIVKTTFNGFVVKLKIALAIARSEKIPREQDEVHSAPNLEDNNVALRLPWTK